MTINEATIRDRLANNLGVIDSKLTLIGTEVYLNNLKGTRGYIDILAKDNHGRYIIIELKRSNEASRQALHETVKYFEAIKENKSLKDNEIIVYVVSTEWKELLVPFSKFVKEISFNLKGFDLLVDVDGEPIHSNQVDPLEVSNSRRLHSQCKICLYHNEANRNKGVASIENIYKEKGILDYVLVLMSNLEVDMFSELPYMIYISTQELSEEEYIRIIKTDADVYADFIENHDYYKSLRLEEYASLIQIAAIDDTKPWVYADWKEIGYPAKFNHKLLQDEGWEIEGVSRYGRLKYNELLTDDVIISELKGDGGENKARYKKVFSLKDKASNNLVKSEVKSCLIDNKVWERGVVNAIDELSSIKEFDSCVIDIHNPMDTLDSIYKSNKEFDELPNDEGLKRCHMWIPSYQIGCESDGRVVVYLGMLADNGKRIELKDYFIKFYDGQVDNYFLKYVATGYNKNDVAEAKELGFDYANFKIEYDKNTHVKKYYKFNGYEFEEVHEFVFNDSMIKFFLKESEFVFSLNELYAKRFFTVGGVDMVFSTNTPQF